MGERGKGKGEEKSMLRNANSELNSSESSDAPAGKPFYLELS